MMMMKACFTTSVVLQCTRRSIYQWGCCATTPSPRGRWDLTRSKSGSSTRGSRRNWPRESQRGHNGSRRDGDSRESREWRGYSGRQGSYGASNRGTRESEDGSRRGYYGSQRGDCGDSRELRGYSGRRSDRGANRETREADDGYRGFRENYGRYDEDEGSEERNFKREKWGSREVNRGDGRDIRGEYSGRESEKGHRRPSTNAETVMIRKALDSGEELLYGLNPVLQALHHGHRGHFTRLFTQIRKGMSEKQVTVEKIVVLAERRGVSVMEVSKGGLNALSGGRPHQGVVVSTGPFPMEEMTSLPGAGVWLALDEVSDPQNVGAIIRSGVFFGVEGVLLCKKNCCGITAVVSKASVGSVEGCMIRYVGSMPRFLRNVRKDGWRVLGLGVNGVSIRDGGGIIGDGKVVMVVGNEGDGLRKMVRDECDQVLRIDGGNDMLDSLNVGVATGIALFQLCRH